MKFWMLILVDIVQSVFVKVKIPNINLNEKLIKSHFNQFTVSGLL